MTRALTPGTPLGRYVIRSRLGAGGMGEVYLAEDTKLDRNVALKILPADVADNRERMRRFVQEAKAASALNHPSIVTIHEIDHADSIHFITTEYIDGVTLRDRVSTERMSLKEALDVCIQVASALATAHGKGIIHRDIKPENIMIRRDGIVKVLDFGLAKLTEHRPAAVDAEAETKALINTEPGVVLGTAQYMSPEQARGLEVDARTDIFSLGVVLYEMVTGQQPFGGATKLDVLSAILNHEPDLLVHHLPEAPRELEHIVSKALRKDLGRRYQTVKDLLIDLEDLKHDLELQAQLEHSVPPVSVSATSSAQSVATTTHYPSSAEYIVSEIKQHKWAVVALTFGSLVVLAAVWYLLPRLISKSKGIPTSLSNATFTQLTDQAGPEYFPSLSPDGKSFVYASYAAGNWDIYFQRVGGKTAINLTKDSTADDTQPAFSPDGERIAFRSEREGGGIFLMGATGESVKRLTNFGFNPTWSPDGREISCADEGPADPAFRINPNSRVWALNVATGEKRLVTKEDSIQPNWSPHGYRIAYGGRRNAAQRDIWTIPAGGGEPVEVTNDSAVEGSPAWSPEGRYLYFASDRAGSMNLWRVPIEEQTGKVLGPAEAVTTPSPYSAQLSFSRDGRRMVYAQIVRGANLQQVGFDPVKEIITGQPVWITQGSRSANTPNVSPDGEWLAFDAQGGKPEDLFVIRRDGTGLRQLTDDSYKDRTPRWSPDGKRIAFYSDRSGKWEVWMINSDGSGLQQITYAPGVVTNTAWSPDGAHLVYRNGVGPPSIIDVRKSWTEQSPQILPILSGALNLWPFSWSPDGRKLALGQQLPNGNSNTVVYSLESQQYEKLTDFGSFSFWLSDSRRLLFQDQNKLYLLDSESKKLHEVLSVAPHSFGNGVTLSRDNRLIYFSLITVEADIWLMTLE